MWQCIQLFLKKQNPNENVKLAMMQEKKICGHQSPEEKIFQKSAVNVMGVHPVVFEVFQSGQMPKNVCLLMFMFSVSQALFSVQTEQQQ